MKSANQLTLAHRSKESGVALVMVLLMALILSLVSAGIIFTVQTDTAISANYKYANEAFHVADGGIQRAINWFNDTTNYNPHVPVTDYTATTSPVQYAAGDAVLAAQTGHSSNFPNDTIANSFAATLGNKTLTADSKNFGTYAVNATLLKTKAVISMTGAPSAVERWRLDSVGYWGSDSAPLAMNRMSAIIENAASPLYNTVLFGISSVTLDGGSYTDSYDPDQGAYGGSNIGQNGAVGSNGVITLTGNAQVNGDALIVPPQTCPTGGNGYSGSCVTMPGPRVFPPIPAFSVGTGSIRNTRTLSPGAYGDIVLAGSDVVTLTSPGTYYINRISITGNASIVIDGPVTLYVKGDLDLGGNSILNATQDPRNLIILSGGTSSNVTKVSGNSGFYGVVYAPNSDLALTGGGNFYGAYIANTVHNVGNGGFHYPDNLNNHFMMMLPFRVINWLRGDS